MKQFEHYRNSIFGRNEEEILWEIRSLGEIATEIYKGTGVSLEQLGSGNFPAVKNEDISIWLDQQFYECVNFVNPNLIKNKKYFEYGNVLISCLGRERAIGKSCVYLGNKKCIAGNNIAVIKHSQNPKYLSYALSSVFCKKQIRLICKESIIFGLSSKDIKKLKIPLPNLETQDQIANSLSRFIELSSEIDCELKLTNKQYEYYKESIFD